MNAYRILGINYNATKEEIKKAYKEIALSCHPDKLVNIDDEEDRKKRIEKFKEASRAYELLMNKSDKCDDYLGDMSWDTYDDSMDWKEMWYNFFNNSTETKEIIKETLVDIGNFFINNKIYPKSYYNPTSTSNLEVKTKHEIKLEVTYNEILMNVKKKLRLILVDIDDPLFIDIYAGAFPQVIKEYTDDNDVEHDIIINMEIKKQEGWDHIILSDGCIDIITSMDITWKEYILGIEKKLEYIDGRHLSVYIPPFQNEYYEIKGKGLKGGCLIVNLCCTNIKNEVWLVLPEKDKVEMIRILDMLS